MRKNKNKRIRIFSRIIFWLTYIFAGFLLYTNNLLIFTFTINLLKLIYPLTIFWLQVRLNNKEKWIPVESSMSTSQLWLRIIPIILCLFTFVLVFINFLIFLINYIF